MAISSLRQNPPFARWAGAANAGDVSARATRSRLAAVAGLIIPPQSKCCLVAVLATGCGRDALVRACGCSARGSACGGQGIEGDATYLLNGTRRSDSHPKPKQGIMDVPSVGCHICHYGSNSAMQYRPNGEEDGTRPLRISPGGSLRSRVGFKEDQRAIDQGPGKSPYSILPHAPTLRSTCLARTQYADTVIEGSGEVLHGYRRWTTPTWTRNHLAARCVPSGQPLNRSITNLAPRTDALARIAEAMARTGDTDSAAPGGSGHLCNRNMDHRPRTRTHACPFGSHDPSRRDVTRDGASNTAPVRIACVGVAVSYLLNRQCVSC
jgi:hypothetical protein